MKNTGWICPKCEAGIAPDQKICPNCDIRSKLDKDKVQDSAIEAIKKAYENARQRKSPGVESLPTWIDSGPIYSDQQPATKCAFDGLTPGTYGLACFCRKCSPYSLGATWKSGTIS